MKPQPLPPLLTVVLTFTISVRIPQALVLDPATEKAPFTIRRGAAAPGSEQLAALPSESKHGILKTAAGDVNGKQYYK